MKKLFDLQSITSEQALRSLLLKIITVFFMLGLVMEVIIFPPKGGLVRWMVFWVYAVSDLSLLLIYLLFRYGRIYDNRALILQALVISAQQCADMVIRTAAPLPITDITFVAAVNVMMIPVFAAGFTSLKKLPFILAGICMLIYCIGTYIIGSIAFIIFISLTVQLFGIAILQRIIMNAWRQAELSKQRIAKQNAVISRFFNITDKEFEQIAGGKMTREKAAKLLERSEKTVSTALIDRVKDVIVKEETVKQAIRKIHTSLTDKDLQLCCHIAEGLTAGEIANVVFKAVSTVTARRSRLRTKFGLKDGDSLRDYILMLVNREMM